MASDQIDVRIVDFPQTRIAVAEHRGPPEKEHETVARLIAWRKAHGVPPARHRSFGIHYDDPRTTPPAAYRVDFGVEFEHDVPPNAQGVLAKVIPAGRCAVARHVGPRDNITTAVYLGEVWLPQSQRTLRDFPIFFHYVHVGPDVKGHEVLTDVYLPVQ
jgi:AraC family transcriptional regulator